MAHIFFDRVWDSTITTGTGSITVIGSHGDTYVGLASVLATNDTFRYVIAHRSANEWEVGIGTYSGSSVFARTTVLAGSNGASAVSFTSGTKDVQIVADASFLNAAREFLIEEQVLSGTDASIDFSSIPQFYRDLRVVARGRGNKAATSCDVHIRFNGDTGNNYDYQRLHGNNATAQAAASPTVSFIRIGSLPGNTGLTDDGGACDATIYGYRGTAFFKNVLANSVFRTSDAAAGQFLMMHAGWWQSASAITSLSVFPDSNDFISGSVFSLYGLR